MGRNYFLTTTYLVNHINSAVLTNSNDSSDTIDVTQYITFSDNSFSDNSNYGSLLYYDDVLQPYYDSKEYVMTIEVEYSNIVPVFTFGTRLELRPGVNPHNSYSVSLGLDNIVDRELSFAQGKGNSIDNRYSVALGVGNTIEQRVVGNGRDYSFAIGKDNKVYGGENVAIGINNTVYSDNGFAFGVQNQATANSFAIGRRNNANRNSLGDISRCSVAIGDGATSTGDGSVALNDATAEGMNSIACNRSYACGINSCTLGKYNVVDSSNQYAVIVGNGSSSSRSNALTLDWSGNLEASGNVVGLGVKTIYEPGDTISDTMWLVGTVTNGKKDIYVHIPISKPIASANSGASNMVSATKLDIVYRQNGAYHWGAGNGPADALSYIADARVTAGGINVKLSKTSWNNDASIVNNESASVYVDFAFVVL